MFADHEQMAKPFAMVGAIGVHAGDHGAMLAHVSGLVVEMFEEVSPLGVAKA